MACTLTTLGGARGSGDSRAGGETEDKTGAEGNTPEEVGGEKDSDSPGPEGAGLRMITCTAILQLANY